MSGMECAHGYVDICSLVVVLERRSLVHDLKTLELLRTLETPANPKVCQGPFVGSDALIVSLQALHYNHICQPQSVYVELYCPCLQSQSGICNVDLHVFNSSNWSTGKQ